MKTFNHNKSDGKKYTCECGREFLNSQQFNAHKSQCKTHLFLKTGSDEAYNKRISQNRKNQQKAIENYKINCSNARKEKEKEWYLEPHYCEKCGAQIKEKIGSGRFCSIKCSYSRIHSDETKKKIGESISKYYEKKLGKKEKFFCKRCGKVLSNKSKTLLCKDCLIRSKREQNIGMYEHKNPNEVSNYLWEHFPAFDCDQKGNVYKNGILIVPFKTSKYFQICLYDKNNSKKVIGVHVIMAMKYLDYYKGCVVHHKDGNTHNNIIDNLVILSRSEHARLHIKENKNLIEANKNKPSWNKGKKMSAEFCRKCSEGAKKRWAKKREV